MKVIENTLKSVIARWDDPGDYPSNAGSGPLPSHWYVEEVTGHVIVQIENEDIRDWMGEVSTHDIEVPEGVGVILWKVKLLPNWQVELIIEEFESDRL